MQMKELLLQFIWQHQYFDKSDLLCTNDEHLQIIYPGLWNKDQGPDFLESKIKHGVTTWAGNIEIHILASDWNKHQHTGNAHYANVILHVVWENDIDLGLPFPTLELKGSISKIMLERYEKLMNSAAFIPCGEQINQVSDIVFNHWKERMLIERLMAKVQRFHADIEDAGYDWENGFWQALAAGFGTSKNTEAFAAIAKSIPINILAKHTHQPHQIEAMLFGQAGLLESDFTEQYPQMLKKEYLFLKQKYNFQQINIPLQFLRMRPANFPGIRLAQLATLLHDRTHLFAAVKAAEDINDVHLLLEASANDYWLYHYVFDRETEYREKRLGKQMINVIIINAIIPFMHVYATYHKDKILQTKMMDWLQNMAAEKNNITIGFEQLGVNNASAWDSQALLHLKKNYCDLKQCLSCAVGVSLLRKTD